MMDSTTAVGAEARSHDDAFASARACFDGMLSWLEGPEAGSLSHAELEDQVTTRGREAQRLALQDHLDLRSIREHRVQAVDATGVVHPNVEPGHSRRLATVVGSVVFERFAYRKENASNLCPADGALNLPERLHSHGLRRLAAIESTRGSFEDASAAISRATGVAVAKRQVEFLASAGAVDVEEFYLTRSAEPAGDADALVISVDGKGIVMRPDALREATAKAADKARAKLATRVSKGEKRNRKRMAEVGAVYDVTPVVRTAAEVLASKSHGGDPAPAPEAANKWVTASVAEDAATVVGSVFEEADRRDPHHRRCWVALVDGNNHQIDRIKAEASKRDVKVSIVIDLIHVLEYIWASAWSFFTEGDAAAEAWVREKTLAVLDGNARQVAAGIRRRASTAHLSKAKRRTADACADYLTNKAAHLDYPTALAAGWPIATGIIEGACRHIVADRMAITGARWSVEGAEAVLKLRAVCSNNDFEEYWRFHLSKERTRVHESRYNGGVIPLAA